MFTSAPNEARKEDKGEEGGMVDNSDSSKAQMVSAAPLRPRSGPAPARLRPRFGPAPARLRSGAAQLAEPSPFQPSLRQLVRNLLLFLPRLRWRSRTVAAADAETLRVRGALRPRASA